MQEGRAGSGIWPAGAKRSLLSVRAHLATRLWSSHEMEAKFRSPVESAPATSYNSMGPGLCLLGSGSGLGLYGWRLGG